MTRILTAMLIGLLAACSADDKSSDTALQESGQTVLNDPTTECPVPAFDFAEQLFTESDRQWFCSVTTDSLTTEDQVYVSRNGQAEMTRFGAVFWNRTLADDSINVASPSVSPFVIRNVFSANTVLTFDLINVSGDTEAYDCVLVGRERTSPELI